ncbi:MAG: hypothetical protein AAF696_19205 [Bacteroidota bacterium]
MKTTVFPKFMLGLSLLGLTTACDPQLEELSQDKLSPIQANEIRMNPEFGFLEFGSQEIFDATYDDLVQNKGTFSLIEGFVSQYDAFNSIDTDEEYKEIISNPEDHPYKSFLELKEDPNTQELEAVRVVASPVMARITNKEGFVRIGNQVQKFISGKILKADNPAKANLSEMSDWKGDYLEGYEIEEINERVLSSNTQEKTLTAYCSNNYTEGNNTFRVVGKQIRRRRGGNTIYLVRVKHQRRRFGAWWANNDAVLGLDFQGAYSTNDDPNTVIDATQSFGTEDDVNEFEEPVTTCPGNCTFIWLLGPNGTHSATQGGNTEECFTNG